MPQDVTISLEIVRDEPTDRAILIRDDTREVWLPRSQITIEYETDDTALVTMPEWLAIDKDLV